MPRISQVSFALLLLAVSAQAAPELGGCRVFPPDNIWNVRVDGLPVRGDSDTLIGTIGASTGLHPDFGSGIWPPDTGGPIGIPYDLVDSTQPPVPIAFLYDDESDPGPYPIPPDARIEGGPNAIGDRHILVVDTDDCLLYELFDAYPDGSGGWDAGSGAVFDLLAHDLRPAGWTSADAAGLAILPGLVRYEEVEAGVIDHALRFTAPQTKREYIWPARHFASALTGSQYPPMGLRVRLQDSFDVSSFSPEIQVILEALKRYGMMLADNGSAWYVQGVPDERWDNDMLHELDDVTGADFEAVDVGSLIVHPDSGLAAVLLFADGFE